MSRFKHPAPTGPYLLPLEHPSRLAVAADSPSPKVHTDTLPGRPDARELAHDFKTCHNLIAGCYQPPGLGRFLTVCALGSLLHGLHGLLKGVD